MSHQADVASLASTFSPVTVDLGAKVVLLPIRHHSPACAWQVASWIDQHRPSAVLVEGPADANAMIPDLLAAATIPPVAFYSFIRSDAGRIAHACWYPFCQYSPEYVALRKGTESGARVAFIDLPTWWHAQLLADQRRDDPVTNIYADHQLSHHAFIQELCKRSQCRDFDDLWDHLYETAGIDRAPEEFWSDVATYCQIARLQSDARDFDKDGTDIREAYMAARIQETLAQASDGPVLVVTGGFHRAGVLELLAGQPSDPRPPARPKGTEHGCYLAAYGDEQLDRWSGYQSGMPAPAYYRRLWEMRAQSLDIAMATTRLLSEIRRYLCEQGEEVSTADLVAAEKMLLGLSRFRGHEFPSREDLRDAIRSTWVKGAMDDAHGHLLVKVDRFLVGSASGQVTSEAGSPPLLRDFEAQTKELRLPGKPTGSGRPKESQRVSLDIHSRPPHRRRSAFLHRLVELGVSYARLEAGPDFVHQTDLQRVREIWQVRWQPAVEGALIERSIYGVTIAEAAQRHLLERFEKSASSGADEAVEILTRALVMAFPKLADELAAAVDARLRSEGDFSAAADAFSGLVNLLAYRAILEANRYPAIETLAHAAYLRSVWLLETLPGMAPQPGEVPGERAVRSLSRLRHIVLAGTFRGIDTELFFEALESVLDRLGKTPLLEGAVLGILRQAGRVDDHRIRQAVRASVDNTAAGPDMPLGEFLRGLFLMIRHAVIERSGLLEIVHDCLLQLPEERFRALLPALRLAFTYFSPREVRRIAELVEGWTRPSLRQMGEQSRMDLAPVEARVIAAWKRLGLETMAQEMPVRAVCAQPPGSKP